jgi:hypothetical protein
VDDINDKVQEIAKRAGIDMGEAIVITPKTDVVSS